MRAYEWTVGEEGEFISKSSEKFDEAELEYADWGYVDEDMVKCDVMRMDGRAGCFLVELNDEMSGEDCYACDI